MAESGADQERGVLTGGASPLTSVAFPNLNDSGRPPETGCMFAGSSNPDRHMRMPFFISNRLFDTLSAGF